MQSTNILKNCITKAITGDILYRCWTAPDGDYLVIRENMSGPPRAYVMEYNKLLSISDINVCEQPITHIKLTQRLWNKHYFMKGWVIKRKGGYVTKDGRKLTWNEILREASERDNTSVITKIVDKVTKNIKVIHEKQFKNYIIGLAKYKTSLYEGFLVIEKEKSEEVEIKQFFCIRDAMKYISKRTLLREI